MLIGVLGLGISMAPSQTLLNSWENSPEGWPIVDTADWTSGGFSTSNATAGSYSWKLVSTGQNWNTSLQDHPPRA